jgi:hypothetical protein
MTLALKEACEIVLRWGTLDRSRVLSVWTGTPDPPRSHVPSRPRCCGAYSCGTHRIDAHDLASTAQGAAGQDNSAPSCALSDSCAL